MYSKYTKNAHLDLVETNVYIVIINAYLHSENGPITIVLGTIAILSLAQQVICSW